MRTDCHIIADLLPLYVDGICSEGSKAMVEEHLKTCEGCRQRLLRYQERPEPEVDFQPKLDALVKVRQSNRRKVIYTAIGVVTAVVVVALIWMWQRSIFHIVDTVWSDDGTRAFVIYNRSLEGDMPGPHMMLRAHDGLRGNRSEGFALHWHRNSLYNIILDGVYQDGTWSPDGSKFVINKKDSSTDITLFDFDGSHSPNIDLFISSGITQAINHDEQRFGYKVAKGTTIQKEFLQWSEDSRAMLIYFKAMNDKEVLGSGYCWYDYDTGTVSSFLIPSVEESVTP